MVVPLSVASLAIVVWAALGSSLTMRAKYTDFLNLYTGACLAHAGQYGHLHDYSVQSAVSRSVVPGVRLVFPFVRPAFYAAAISPLARLPYAQAFWIWIGFQSALLLVCWYWAWRVFGPDSLIWASLFLPTALGIPSGQDCVVVLAVGCAAWEAYRRRLDPVAGLFLALLLVKFHLFLLVPVALVARRRWQMLGGYATGAIALALISLHLGGWSGVTNYAALLASKDLAALSPSPEQMLGIHTVLAALGIVSLPLTLALSAGVVFLVVRSACAGADDWRWLWAAVAGSLLISPHTYQYDAAILLIPALLAISHGETPALRVLGAIVLTPLLYALNLAGTPYSAIPSLALMAFLLALTGALPFDVRHPRATSAPLTPPAV